MTAWQCGGQGFESPQLHPYEQAVPPSEGRPLSLSYGTGVSQGSGFRICPNLSMYTVNVRRTRVRERGVIISCRSTSPAPDGQIAAEISQVLEKRAALKHPPVSMAVSDAVALGIAGVFSSPTPSGQVLARLYRHGSVDSDELLEAARVEQGYASPEGHAALYCLIGWMHAQVYREQAKETS